MDGETSSSSQQHTPRKMKETDLMETMIKSTTQMRNTIAESTNNLVKAVSGSSNDRTKTMIMEDLSKAHILYEKSLASLKKKEKDWLKQQTRTSYVKSFALRSRVSRCIKVTYVLWKMSYKN